MNPVVDEAPDSVNCVRGKQCELSCLIEGVPAPLVTFIKNGDHVVVEAGRSDLKLVNSSNYTHSRLQLVIEHTQLQDSGQYACNATNTLNTTQMVFSVEAQLTVHCKMHTCMDV